MLVNIQLVKKLTNINTIKHLCLATLNKIYFKKNVKVILFKLVKKKTLLGFM